MDAGRISSQAWPPRQAFRPLLTAANDNDPPEPPPAAARRNAWIGEFVDRLIAAGSWNGCQFAA